MYCDAPTLVPTPGAYRNTRVLSKRKSLCSLPGDAPQTRIGEYAGDPRCRTSQRHAGKAQPRTVVLARVPVVEPALARPDSHHGDAENPRSGQHSIPCRAHADRACRRHSGAQGDSRAGQRTPDAFVHSNPRRLLSYLGCPAMIHFGRGGPIMPARNQDSHLLSM